jgi:hypothetical protein
MTHDTFHAKRPCQTRIMPAPRPAELTVKTRKPSPSRSSFPTACASPLSDSLTSLQWLRGFSCASVITRPIPTADMRDAAQHDEAALDWRVNSSIKPPFSYPSLIYMAMKASSKDRHTLADIYAYITGTFAYYRSCEPGWKVCCTAFDLRYTQLICPRVIAELHSPQPIAVWLLPKGQP